EIHMGRTTGEDTRRPFAHIGKGAAAKGADGATSANGKVQGTYFHGVFTNDGFRRAWLADAGAQTDATLNYSAEVERALDALADGVEAAVDIDALLGLAKHPRANPTPP
ncbi:MAG: cobyric acid synthase CobQ, partial [Pseudomonadota bacterium]